MGYLITTVDRTTLPAALLPIAKDHMRIDFSDDDAMIQRYMSWAISYLEIFWGQRLFSATVTWTPVDSGAIAQSRYQTPVQPVSDFSVSSALGDITADYALEVEGGMVNPFWLVRSDGTAFANDAEVTLTAGFAALDDIEPAVQAGILRVGSSLYEYRESISSISLEQMPFWMNDLLGGLWVPRA